MAGRVEDTILTNLIMNVEYMRQCIPHLTGEYFHEPSDKILFDEISDFVAKYNTIPTKEALGISISEKNIAGRNDSPDYSAAFSFVQTVDEGYEKPNTQWASDITEKFCQDKALFNGIVAALDIMEGRDKTISKDGIPEMLSKALAVSFDHNIGHNYIKDAEARYDYYTKIETRIPFDIDILNKITRGGLPEVCLGVFLGGTGTGKTNLMCHFAADYLKQGYNVLYITLEMQQERIGERIDANLLNVPIADVVKLGKEAFMGRINKLEAKTQGELIIKEYPMRSAHAGHFKALIDELKLKKDFRPDIILVDYLGICASARYKNGSNVNTNTFFQSVAEELRAISQHYKVPVVTAIQTNRTGSTNSDLDMTDSADSFGIAMTADLFIGLHTNDDLAALNQLMMKVLKNRFNDVNYYKKFMVGVDRAKMRIFNLEETAQVSAPEDDELPEFPDYILSAPDVSTFNFD
jgi:replicative DNA helicase